MRVGAARTSAALAVAALTVLSACSVGPSRRPGLAVAGSVAAPVTAATTAPSTRPSGPGGAGQQADPVDWQDCPSSVEPPSAGQSWELQCAEVQVPIDRSVRNSDTVPVAISRVRTASTPQDAPPLLVLLGEPGENGRDDVARVAAGLDPALLAQYSIVTLDVRGTGRPWDELQCLEDRTIANLLAPPQSVADRTSSDLVASISKDAVFDCADTAQNLITDVTTTDVADDLDAIRDAMGVDTVTLFGQGWGATVGAVYVDRYPGRVRAAVLDSPSDATATAAEQIGARADALEAALDAFAADCAAATGGCPLGDDPRTAVERVVDELGDTGDTGDEFFLTGGSVLLALTTTLGTPSEWPALIDALRAAQQGELAKVEALVTASVSREDTGDLAQARLEYTCNDSSIRLTADDMRSGAAAAVRTAPLFGPFVAGQLGLCSAWPTATAALGRLSGTGAPPVLVTGSTADPVSPYAGAQAIADQLSSAILVSWQAGQHGAVTGSSCVRKLAISYLTTGTAPADGRLCPP